MPFLNSLSSFKASRGLSGYRPEKVGTLTLTAGDSTDTFSWSAPRNNGIPITKYGYQVSSDNGSTWYSAVGGTLNGETEVATASAVLSTQYKNSSYKVRVRAFNAAGWGPYSDISTSGTVAWEFGPMTDNGTCSSFSCSCGSCTCGTNTGTNSTATGTRTCHRWTRLSTGSTSGPLRNPTDTGSCSTSYTGCTGGTCTSCTGCGTTANVTTAGTYNGSYYTPIENLYGQTRMALDGGRGSCVCPQYYLYTITSCTQNSVTTYTVTALGCEDVDGTCK